VHVCGFKRLRLLIVYVHDLLQVISVCIEKTEDQGEDNHLRYSGEVEQTHHNNHHQKQISKHHHHVQKEDTTSPSLCNHPHSSGNDNNATTTTTTTSSTAANGNSSQKRKIPKSEDSPLISSTRDDLGECGINLIYYGHSDEREFLFISVHSEQSLSIIV
jgi:hypothetical protein